MTDDLDLNLLRVFDALMDTGSVSAAAERLHMSVPATSRALGRLRRALDDPLLVRAGRGLVPTPFALGSAGRVRKLLEDAAELFTDRADDEPRKWRRSFAVRLNDGLSPVLAPRLISRIAGEAPDVTLRFVTDDSDHPDALRNGSIDLDIGLTRTFAPDVRVRRLYVDRFVVVVSSRSVLGRVDRLTVDQLCHYPHVSSQGQPMSLLDTALERIGRSRRVVAALPTYAVSSLLALEDDIIVVVPHILARHLVERHVPVRWHELPLALPSLGVDQRWHARLDGSYPSQWLRSHVAAALEGLVADDEPLSSNIDGVPFEERPDA
ncbi:LysR family transcriptional regulator [Actinomadura welshii]|uniref:LysR family transcriptional regulator n=1 Tax=Actinomadura welshii TaxID=3103817 RepID=UPI0003AD362D|nr:LysR family transcriptional regulator [Actinomadura madurae]